MNKPTRAEEVPCPHMRNIISPLADGTLGGLLLWYARHHVANCVRCTQAVTAMIALRGQLGGLGALIVTAGLESEPSHTLTQTRRNALNDALNRLDAAVAESDTSSHTATNSPAHS